MAATNLAAVAAALSLVYRRNLTSSINRLAVLPFLLPIVKGSGKALNWTAEFTGAANATPSTDGVARSSSDADAELEIPATLPWAQYDKVASVTDMAQFATGTNFNPGSIRTVGGDLLMGKIEGQISRLGLGLATDFYAGNPGATPPGLAGAARAIDSSGTFAGIDPTTYTEWAAAENSIALAALSVKNIRQYLLTPVYDACGEQPEFMTTTSAIFDAVKDLFSDKEKYVREFVVARGGGKRGNESRAIKLEAGVDAVMVDGVPLIRDRQCTASTIYAWNTRYVSVHQLDPFWDVQLQGPAAILEMFRQLTENPNLDMPQEELEGMAAVTPGIRPYIKVLGNRGLSTEAAVVAMAQIEWTRRNAFGKLLLT